MTKPVLLCLLFAAVSFGAGRKQLFNGKDLDGWQITGPGRFVVEGGILRTEGGMGLLWYTRQMFGDCTIRVIYKPAAQNSNSGVFIRLPEPPSDPWYAVHNGFEVQIDGGNDDWHTTGAIYSLSKIIRRNQNPPGQWNTLEIRLNGPLTTVSVNGAVVNQFDPSKPVPERTKWHEPVRGPRPNTGYIGLQNHDARSVVYFREVSVGTR